MITQQDLRNRTKQFAIEIILFLKKMEISYEDRIIIRQLLRSSTSVAANYRAACRGRSNAEFYSKICIVLEEADETLFWLEVGDGHKSKNQIADITNKRLNQAMELCRRTGVRLVYTQLSTNWVHEAARWACAELPNDVAVVMGNQRKFGEFPMMEWGKTTTR